MSYMTLMVPHTSYGIGIIWSPNMYVWCPHMYVWSPQQVQYDVNDSLWSPLPYGIGISWSPLP